MLHYAYSFLRIVKSITTTITELINEVYVMKNYTETELDNKINAFLEKKGVKAVQNIDIKVNLHDERRSPVEWLQNLFTTKVSAPLR